MDHKIAASLLLVSAGLSAALGVLGAQIANAIVLGAFYTAHMDGEVPSGPQAAGLHWVVIVAVALQAGLGLYLLFGARDSGR